MDFSPINQLPYERLVHLFTFIDLDCIPNVSLVSQTWHKAANDEIVWERMAKLNSFSYLEKFNHRTWKSLCKSKVHEERLLKKRAMKGCTYSIRILTTEKNDYEPYDHCFQKWTEEENRKDLHILVRNFLKGKRFWAIEDETCRQRIDNALKALRRIYGKEVVVDKDHATAATDEFDAADLELSSSDSVDVSPIIQNHHRSLVHLFSFIDPKCISNVSLVSRAWHQAANDEIVWIRIAKLIGFSYWEVFYLWKAYHQPTWKGLCKHKVSVTKEFKKNAWEGSALSMIYLITENNDYEPYDLYFQKWTEEENHQKLHGLVKDFLRAISYKVPEDETCRRRIVNALKTMGQFYEEGNVVDKDNAKALAYYQGAADLEPGSADVFPINRFHHKALVHLFNFIDPDCIPSVSLVSKEWHKAANDVTVWMRVAILKHFANCEAYNYPSWKSFCKYKVNEERQLKKQAREGCIQSMITLATKKNDYEPYDLYFQKWTEEENHEKLHDLVNGFLEVMWHRVPEDDTCRQQIVNALKTMGQFYEEGTVVDKDVATAAKYYRDAADLELTPPGSVFDTSKAREYRSKIWSLRDCPDASPINQNHEALVHLFTFVDFDCIPSVSLVSRAWHNAANNETVWMRVAKLNHFSLWGKFQNKTWKWFCECMVHGDSWIKKKAKEGSIRSIFKLLYKKNDYGPYDLYFQKWTDEENHEKLHELVKEFLRVKRHRLSEETCRQRGINALKAMGKFYGEGIVVDKDTAEAAKYYQEAADLELMLLGSVFNTSKAREYRSKIWSLRDRLNVTPISQRPHGALVHLFTFIDFDCIPSISLVSKEWHKAANDETVWMRVAKLNHFSLWRRFLNKPWKEFCRSEVNEDNWRKKKAKEGSIRSIIKLVNEKHDYEQYDLFFQKWNEEKNYGKLLELLEKYLETMMYQKGSVYWFESKDAQTRQRGVNALNRMGQFYEEGIVVDRDTAKAAAYYHDAGSLELTMPDSIFDIAKAQEYCKKIWSLRDPKD